MFFDRFRKKKKEKEVSLPVPTKLPEDLERFRVRERYEPSLPPVETPKVIPKSMDDKIELILQKLETIDARLRLLEERLS